MAKIIAQNYSPRRNGYGKPSLHCDTGGAPSRVMMAGTGYQGEGEPRLTIIMEDEASETRFKVQLDAAEVVKLATIVLGPVLADLAEEARAKLAKVVK